MKDELLQLFQTKNSVKEILEEIGFCYHVHSYKRLEKIVKDNNIQNEYDNFKNKSKSKRAKNFIENIATKKVKRGMECFTENSNTARTTIRHIVIREELLEYKCQCCGQEPFFNGNELILQLDHINGINNDHRLENLRFLCPNCHSQTETHSGKNRANRCEDCGVIISSKATKCIKCSSKNKSNKRKFEITKEELNKLINEDKVPFTRIGKMFNVSDTAIRKRAKKLGII